MGACRNAVVVSLVFIGVLGSAPLAGADVPCIEPLDQQTVDTLILHTWRPSVQPGQKLYFTLGTWECCVFVSPVPACAEYSVEPAGAATVTILQDGTWDHGPGTTGYLEVAPSVPHGTVLTLTADVESGRKVLALAVNVYTPEGNPLVGNWHEVSQTACGGFIRGRINGDSVLDLTDAIGLFAYLFMGAAAPACLQAADVTADGKVDITDGVALLGYLFRGEAPPPAPFTGCGTAPDPSDLGCAASAACPSTEVAADSPIMELLFDADGSFSVTWMPFEVYVDYWGTYTYDRSTGTVLLHVEGGNYVPPDVQVGPGKFSVAGGSLHLEGIWLGSSRDVAPVTGRCGQTFQR
jgi:hypothetical protein